MNLNIIGNGFDLYHGLPSSYYYFGCYLIENDSDLYMALSKWFRFKYYSKARGYPYEDFEYGVEEQFWSYFEERLGIVDETAIIDTYDSDLGLEINDYDIPMDDDQIANELRKMFISWVSNTLDIKDNYRIIRKFKNITKNKKHYKMGFTNSDRYLLFNYTHVLQNIYGIQPINICYVHGECTGDDDDELIFGHGNKERIEEIKDIIYEYNNRSLYQSERTNQLEYECLLRFMETLEKDVNRCKWNTENFYNHFSEEPDFINVYGMSLGNVDYPYFKQIRGKWPKTKWRFSYYSILDEDKINELVKRLAIPKSQFITFKFDNPICWEVMDTIVAKTGITLYKEVKSR
ncbi:AbiH family protein [Anaeromicropila herbilytica]|uniref:Bacteriophage abortive infection AbiH n=1 Tax=Anaeromicropila herbilytica TaxID=2785025 RepID=A0A7R7ELF9_9FIRM|nr:AbiH family protein [Anaeromicropila herbilytica]BCN30959.1 hypothetical protein bsdtb5_22540 [Anaeromicropila herbilytica]